MNKPLGRAIFSSASDEWATPTDVYESLHAEFHFVDDPCPLGGGAEWTDARMGFAVLCQPAV